VTSAAYERSHERIPYKQASKSYLQEVQARSLQKENPKSYLQESIEYLLRVREFLEY
jgi:hypothetical protein